jgi:hypothetical protein
MKTYFSIILSATLLALVSCSDILDIKPTDFVSDALIWEDRSLVDQFVANTYGSLVCGFNRTTQGVGQDWSAAFGGNFDAGTDDFDGKFDADVNQFNTGQITSLSTPFASQIWQSNYQIIFKCNMIIESVRNVSDDKVLNENERKRYEAEARFLRAFCYFDLAKTFGKAPLITHVQKLDEDLLVAPSSFADIVAFISEECDAYIQDMYLTVSTETMGHATKGAFLALKTRALLYLASPLNNPQNNLQRWTDAAKAADEVRKLGIYDLYTQGNDAYYDQFFDKTANNKETIFDRKFKYREATHSIHMQWSLDGEDRGSWNGLYPTQNLVDAYEMDNGKPINDPASGYDPQNPYNGRDSRFYQSILYHGCVWETTPLSMLTNTADGPNGNCQPSIYKARCGYGPKKLIEEHSGPAGELYDGTYAQDNNWPYFRYAEILLNYAEAQNEALPAPDPTVYDAVNQVRSRAGQPDLPTGLTQSQMRERIKNERRIEFCLEEHRFFDLRRWKDTDKLRETITGMTVQGDGTTNQYIVVDIEPRAFNETHYYLPIPQVEIDKNPLLAQ